MVQIVSKMAVARSEVEKKAEVMEFHSPGILSPNLNLDALASPCNCGMNGTNECYCILRSVSNAECGKL
jgi:hypothetical protein